MKLTQICHAAAFLLTSVALTGCSASTNQEPATTNSEILLRREPAGAIGVRQAVKEAKDQSELVLVGRIGGEANPWVEDAAAFTIVDTALKPCNERAGDSCPTPWDYCCDIQELPAATATIKIVDRQGTVIPKDARQLLPLKELQTVVVRGRAQRGAEGSLVVLADALYVRR